jgi:hypothetical protein
MYPEFHDCVFIRFRYANMDFLVFFTLLGVVFTWITISYDIACQWSRNIAKRIPQFPSWMQPPPQFLHNAKFVIPKFHIYSHGSSCQTNFSLNFLKYSARTNGEEPERWWAHINPVSMSTREMSLAARHDTIDDHAAAWNWRKIASLGQCPASKISTYVSYDLVLVCRQGIHSINSFKMQLRCKRNTTRFSQS